MNILGLLEQRRDASQMLEIEHFGWAKLQLEGAAARSFSSLARVRCFEVGRVDLEKIRHEVCNH